MGIFGKLFGALKKTKDNFSSKLRVLFSKNKQNEISSLCYQSQQTQNHISLNEITSEGNKMKSFVSFRRLSKSRLV